MPPIDLAPASLRLAALVASIPDEMLGRPTPCPDYSVADLLAHIDGLAQAFAAAAAKDPDSVDAPPPGAELPPLPADWRSEIPERLGAMTEAWRHPGAWEGMTEVGGVELPGEICGLVGLDELVVHGWDLAQATDQPFEAEPLLLESLVPLFGQFEADGPFGPPVPVAEDAPLLDRVIGLTGRDPSWRPDRAIVQG